MNSEQPPQSPCAPGFDGIVAADARTPAAPDPYQGGEPRLGILHLLVWTACVALVLGIDQSFTARFRQNQSGSVVMLLRGLSALGTGAGLGGVLLWGWRRRHGWPFPRHPGEYLLVVMGLLTIFDAMLQGVLCALIPTDGRFPYTWFGALSCYHALTSGAVYSMAAWGAKTGRWKAAFLVCLAMGVLRQLMPFYSSLANIVVSLPADLAVAIAVLIDWQRRLRFPWLHWLGIAVFFWVAIASALWWMLLRLN